MEGYCTNRKGCQSPTNNANNIPSDFNTTPVVPQNGICQLLYIFTAVKVNKAGIV